VARLDNVGITAAQEEIVTSAMALATMLEPGSTALAVADGGLLEALAMRGVTVVDDGPCDAVVVDGRTASTSNCWRGRRERSGAAPASSAPTRTPPIRPRTGSSPGRVRYSRRWPPPVASTPRWQGTARPDGRAPQSARTDAAVMVGDRPATDGRMAEALGVPYALVYSGVTAEGSAPSQPAHAASAADLGALVRAVLAST